jgi:glutathione peroxidase
MEGAGRRSMAGSRDKRPSRMALGDITWNFAKFVVNRAGSVVARFDPSTATTAPELRAVIRDALGA